MKRVIALLLCLGMLAVAVPAKQATAEGIYVAPKFIYGFTQMNGMKGSGALTHDYLGTLPVSLRIGNKSDSAWGGALAIGYDFYKQNRVPMRAELEYAIFSEVSGKSSWSGAIEEIDPPVDFDLRMKQKLQAQTLFVNVYYDFRNDTPFTPWVGAGLGMAFVNSKGNFNGWLEGDDNTFSESLGSKRTTNFAWNIGTGVAYEVTENVALDFGYRFVGLGKAETKTRSMEIEVLGDPVSMSTRARTKNVYMHQVMLGLRFTF